MIQLRIRVPGQEPKVLTLDGDRAVIGRSADCEVEVASGYVSKRHAVLLHGVVLADLASRNGVWVDGARLSEPCLPLGKPFRLGEDPATSPEVEILAAMLPGEASRVWELEQENRRLVARLAELEARLIAVPSDAPARRNAASRDGARAPAVPAVVPMRDRERQKIIEMIDALIAEDVGDRPPMIEGPVDESSERGSRARRSARPRARLESPGAPRGPAGVTSRACRTSGRAGPSTVPSRSSGSGTRGSR